jgi:hypothetical protein
MLFRTGKAWDIGIPMGYLGEFRYVPALNISNWMDMMGK